MLISEHADRTEKLHGIRGEEIHRWIDGWFDRERFTRFLKGESEPGYCPYEHRPFRHCREALSDAVRTFGAVYTEEQIGKVFLTHLQDDYDGYIPTREDFSDSRFTAKYHEGTPLPVMEEPLASNGREAGDVHPARSGARSDPDSCSESSPESDRASRPAPGESGGEPYAADGDPILTPAELAEYFRRREPGRRNGRNRSAGPGEKKAAPMTSSGLSAAFLLRIVLPAAATLILLIASTFLVILPLFHDSLLEERRQMISGHTALAVSILTYYGQLEREGQLSREQARQTAVDEIRKLRYGEDQNNYFWITDMQPVMIMHPWHPELIGTNLSQYTDSLDRSGKRLFVEAVELVERSGGGFLEYLWQLDEQSTRIVPKLSYVQGFPLWGWVIGTGDYIHDVEEEIDRLSGHAAALFLIVAGAVSILLLYLVLQSRGIERRRRLAEAGLAEAKNRYRALVEASNEGYLLLFDGRVVFSNPAFRRMAGCLDADLQGVDPWPLLFPESRRGAGLEPHLANLTLEYPAADEFEAVIRFRNNEPFEAIITVSRIFLTGRNGIIAAVRPIIRDLRPLLDFRTVTAETDAAALKQMIAACRRSVQVVRMLTELPKSVRSLVVSGQTAAQVRNLIDGLFRTAAARLTELAMEELDVHPSVPFAFLLLGSSGRGELTLFSDQDNALVFAAPGRGPAVDRERRELLVLARRVCLQLEQGGFPYCPGGIMAMNPEWCLSADEWNDCFNRWTARPDSESLLDLHVFFDAAHAWGDAGLTNGLKREIDRLIGARPEFLAHFARSSLGYRAPLGFLGGLKGRPGEHGEEDVFNIKAGLIPIINFARIYALRHAAGAAGSEPSTLGRLKALYASGVVDERLYSDLVGAFETLWRLRFINQIAAHGQLRRVSDDLRLSDLSAGQKDELRRTAAVIPVIQSRVSYDFLGIDLS